MEITLYLMLSTITLFFTYLSFSRTVYITNVNKFIAGLCWLTLSINSFVIHYYLVLSNDYIRLADNSKYWQMELAFLFAAIGLMIWYQILADNLFSKEEI